MAKKQLIRLTEGDLHKIIKESINKILNEESPLGIWGSGEPFDWQVFVRGELLKSSDRTFDTAEEAINDCDKFLNSLDWDWEEEATNWNYQLDEDDEELLTAAYINEGDTCVLNNYGESWSDFF